MLATLGASTTESIEQEVRFGVGRGRLGDRVGPQEPGGDHQLVAVLGCCRHALGTVVGALGRRLGGADAEVGDGPVESGGGGVVERLVAATGDVEHQGDGRATTLGRRSATRRLGAGRCGARWLGARRFRGHRLGPRRCSAGGFGPGGGGPGDCAEVDALTDVRHRSMR